MILYAQEFSYSGQNKKKILKINILYIIDQTNYTVFYLR